MFGLFKKSYEITFTDELAPRLECALIESYKYLRDSGHSAQADCLERILKSVNDRNIVHFKKQVLSNDLLGGSGSVLDVWIENSEIRKKFDKSFHEFLCYTLQLGLTHRDVKQAERIARNEGL